MEMREQLNELKNALFDFSRRNPLVNSRPQTLWFIDHDTDQKNAERIYRKSNFFKREYGLDTVLDVRLFIKWSPPPYQGKSNDSFVISPLFYYPSSIKYIRRIDTTYVVEKESDKGIVNPIIIYYFKKWYGLDIPSEIEVEALCGLLEKAFSSTNQNNSISQVSDFTNKQEWEIIAVRGIGNFNYKKSVLHADYDVFIDQPNLIVQHLLGVGDLIDRSKEQVIEMDHLDQSQRSVIKDAIKHDLVIQGPPGTGKSHTIVSLITNYLASGKKVLFVSEKRVALQVVQERLAALHLGHMTAFFNTQKDQKKRFYKRLQHTLQRLNDWKTRTDHISSNASRKGEVLNFYINELHNNRTDFSASYNHLIEALAKANLSIAELTLSGSVPKYEIWNNALSLLQKIEEDVALAFRKRTIGDCGFMHLNPAVFQEKDPTVMLEKRFSELFETLTDLKSISKRFDLTVHVEGLTRLALTGSVLNMVNKVQLDLLNSESKKYRSFNNWAKKYATLKTKIKHAEKANAAWTKKPSLSEITELLDMIRTSEARKAKIGIFRNLKRSPSRLKEAFRDFHSTISDHAKIKLLEGLQLEWRLRAEFDEVVVKLNHHFNMGDPENEIDLIFNLRTRLDRVSSQDYLIILEHQNSDELIKVLAELHPKLAKASGQLKFLFAKFPLDHIADLNAFISQFREDLPLIHHWLPELRQLFELPSTIRQTLTENNKTVAEISHGITYHALMTATRFEPAFKRLSGWQLMSELSKGLIDRRVDQDLERKRLRNKWFNTYKTWEDLATTPAIKLNGEDKQQKKGYKKARKRFLHESHKQQQHMAVRDFFEETNPYLLDIQPLWMMNPLTVSEFLPCQADLFDVVIFDESSQIPLEDALPSIYRAKQLIVVGDSNQMPPGTFFSSRTETLSLLDQADVALKSNILKWHYRSSHPSLIEFSNRHFYDNQLVCLPPFSSKKPIDFRHVEKGRFDKGKNETEASALVSHLSELIDHKKSILIIAFSLEQEKCIRKHLNKGGIETGRLLEVRNLENVQGTQADIVMISIGYGYNEEGVFRQSFGPVNQDKGANRLNVMFTRAKEQMIVFSSVQAIDFKWSENRGVQVLRDFIEYCQKHQKISTLEQPERFGAKKIAAWIKENNLNEVNYHPARDGLVIDGFIHEKNQRILLIDPIIRSVEVDFLNLYHVLSQRFSEVKIVLSYDIWQQQSRVKEEVVTFFSK